MADLRTVPHRVTGLPIRTLRVEVVQGPDTGKRFVAGTDTISVGTADDNDLILTDNTVSRYHLELKHLGELIAVRDQASTNGTALNGGAVLLDRARVRAGTLLSIGRTTLRADDGETVDQELLEGDTLGPLRGRSPSMRRLMAQLQRAAQSDVSVLILGETGSGKEVVARAIHETSRRASGPFETVDCGALAPALVASELFGHEKGAFTGADQRYIGAFERADGGTLFLDELGELPASLQPVLLGALERRSFRRVGGTERIDVDVRLLSATNRDLRSEVNRGTFRQDLYYRTAVLRLTVPPLRDRPEDLPLLAEHFLRLAGFDGALEEVLPPSALAALRAHRWPGNVRELRNFVEAALAMGEAPGLESDGLAVDRSAPAPFEALLELPYKDARARVLDDFERTFLEALLSRSGGNVSEAARQSKIHRSYLIEMLKRHGLR